MGSNAENLRELPDIQYPLLLFKNLKTDLDKLKSQIGNLKKYKTFFQIAARNKFEKRWSSWRKVPGIHRKQTQP